MMTTLWLLQFGHKKTLIRFWTRVYKIGHRPTLPPVTAVPLALAGLTSLFGMGRGGHRRYRHLKILKEEGWMVEGWKVIHLLPFALRPSALKYLNILEKVLE